MMLRLCLLLKESESLNGKDGTEGPPDKQTGKSKDPGSKRKANWGTSRKPVLPLESRGDY